MNEKYVIVRADRAGVFFGVLKSKTHESVILKDCRKLYFWSGAAAVEQLATEGVKNKEGCKFTVTVTEMEIENPIQVIPCSQIAIENILSVKEWKI